MKIDSYEVQSSSQYKYQKLDIVSSKTGLVNEAALAAGKAAEPPATKPQTLADLNAEVARQLAAQAEANNKPQEQTIKVGYIQSWTPLVNNPQDLKIRLLELMFYALTGKRYTAQELNIGSINRSNIPAFSGGAAPSGPLRKVTQTDHYSYESQSVKYQAQGQIKTADGQTISVDISMYMSREFVSQSSSTLVWAQPVDPLVINYGGTAASLTQQKYDFDLTMDGAAEQISFAGPGSGFLAVDWNGDGVINDGSELFGPQQGDGFAELRAHDQDGNGWIDESDEIFSKLLVWSKDENGNDQLYTLQELDIGAIYLGNVNTQFAFMDGSNSPDGVMRSSSFFLREDGSAGTLSQIDLTI